jgi:orotidine-5'-phosphate decarboxylase
VTFINKLSAAWTANDSLLCVGLDPDLAKLPAQFQNDPQGIYHFCREIIDATADLACSFKPQIAYLPPCARKTSCSRSAPTCANIIRTSR